MANPLNLEEQAQIDQIKHFWAQYGNFIAGILIVIAGAFAAWNGWNYWQRTQAIKASALYDEIQRATASADTDRINRALGDLQGRFGGSAFADQGALLAAKTLTEMGKVDAARAALQAVSERSKDESHRAVARLRIASLDLDAKAYEKALKTLENPMPASFAALLADRRGDIYKAMGKTDEARQQYEFAWHAFNVRTEYRNLVEVKLAALGVDVAALAASAEAVR